MPGVQAELVSLICAVNCVPAANVNLGSGVAAGNTVPKSTPPVAYDSATSNVAGSAPDDAIATWVNAPGIAVEPGDEACLHSHRSDHDASS